MGNSIHKVAKSDASSGNTDIASQGKEEQPLSCDLDAPEESEDPKIKNAIEEDSKEIKSLNDSSSNHPAIKEEETSQTYTVSSPFEEDRTSAKIEGVSAGRKLKRIHNKRVKIVDLTGEIHGTFLGRTDYRNHVMGGKPDHIEVYEFKSEDIELPPNLWLKRGPKKLEALAKLTMDETRKHLRKLPNFGLCFTCCGNKDVVPLPLWFTNDNQDNKVHVICTNLCTNSPKCVNYAFYLAKHINPHLHLAADDTSAFSYRTCGQCKGRAQTDSDLYYLAANGERTNCCDRCHCTYYCSAECKRRHSKEHKRDECFDIDMIQHYEDGIDDRRSIELGTTVPRFALEMEEDIFNTGNGDKSSVEGEETPAADKKPAAQAF